MTQQWNTKRYVSIATVTHATIEKLSEEVFSVRSAPEAARLCNIAAAEAISIDSKHKPVCLRGV
jgi:hypothetical protein